MVDPPSSIWGTLWWDVRSERLSSAVASIPMTGPRRVEVVPVAPNGWGDGRSGAHGHSVDASPVRRQHVEAIRRRRCSSFYFPRYTFNGVPISIWNHLKSIAIIIIITNIHWGYRHHRREIGPYKVAIVDGSWRESTASSESSLGTA